MIYILTVRENPVDSVRLFIGCLDVVGDMGKWLVNQGFLVSLQQCELENLPNRSEAEADRAQEFMIWYTECTDNSNVDLSNKH